MTPITVAFYVAAFAYAVAFAAVVFLRHHVLFYRYMLWGFVVPMATLYTGLLVEATLRNPAVLLRMDLTGVVAQLSDATLQVSSVIHFELGDMICLLVAFRIADHYHMSWRHYWPAIVLMMLWAPVGQLAFILLFFLAPKNKKGIPL